MDKNDELCRVDILDVLFDEHNTAPIYMEDDRGHRLAFEQVAVIPYEKQIYCILKPMTKLEGIKDNEAFVFRVEEDEFGNSVLRVETDDRMNIAIFNKYYDLIEEHLKKKD